MLKTLTNLRKVQCWRQEKHLQLILLAVLLLLSPIWAYGQATTVTGKVIDEAGAPLPGVNIIVKGTSTGTLSDIDGNYRLESEIGEGAVLVFTFIGYESQEIAVGAQSEINVAMILDIQALQEVVVVGYSTQRKGEVTGSFSTVNAEVIPDMVAVTAAEVLKGNVSGVTVIESHTPGESAKVRIRGLGTINNNDPLWIIDGVQSVSDVVPTDVIPNNIESITVLKDASAQAIYGARASNGVILVTTKSGKRNRELQVNLTVRGGISKNVNSYDLLNTREYGELLWLMAANDGLTGYSHPLYGDGPTPDIPEYILPARGTNVDESLYDNLLVHEDGDDTYLITKANREGTNWLDEVTRNAQYQEYGVNVSGGSENTSYAFMFNYLKEEGILLHTDYERYNLRTNVTFHPTDWLEIGEKIGITISEDRGLQRDNAEGSSIFTTNQMLPILPVRDIAGNFAGTRASNGNGSSPAARLFGDRFDRNRIINPIGNVYAKATFFESLSIQSLLGFNVFAFQRRDINFVEKAYELRPQFDRLRNESRFGYQWNWSNTLEYSKTFGLHNVTILGGLEAIDNTLSWHGGSRENYFAKEEIYFQLDAGSLNQANFGNSSEWSMFSVFGRVNYAFSGKYFLAATVRRDGSSRFGEENRYGTFPALSVGWGISDESFMHASRNWLDYLKIRASWGQTGNDQIGNYNSFTTFVQDVNDSFYPIGGGNSGGLSTGFRRSSIGNQTVKWETTTTANIGLDAIFLNNLSLSLDLWQRNTDDMLFRAAIPDVIAGIASIPSVNVGNMKNKGIDIELGYQRAAFGIALNVSHYKTEVEKLSGVENEFIQGSAFRGLRYTRTESGRAFPEFYGIIVEGIFQTQAEADAHPTAFGPNGTYNQPGNFKYTDVNGDGVIDDGDRTYIGSPHPDFTAGLNLNFQYKGFDLSTRLYASVGNEMYNEVLKWIDFETFIGNRSQRRLYESWGSPHLANNADATLPKAVFTGGGGGGGGGSRQPSTYFVEDASYLRMTALKLSYDLAPLIKGLDLRGLRIYTQITNLFTLTEYSGLDPEVNAQGINNGIDRGAWPTPRRILLGVNLDF